jgi:hypothetical protein
MSVCVISSAECGESVAVNDEVNEVVTVSGESRGTEEGTLFAEEELVAVGVFLMTGERHLS